MPTIWERLIPAHAGKTHPPGAGGQGREAHPRSRGENVSLERPSGRSRGSSPLTRGKLASSVVVQGLDGLIPAHAGKTRKAGGQCRESAGSSPLTRGKRPQGTARRGGRGLIPAHAGKTTATWPPPSRSPAHPRSRGENWQWIAGIATEVGSSPLTRGKLQRQGQTHPVVGLIPAHAGKTKGNDAALTPSGAHPRSRGENPRAPRGRAHTQGSSPLTRGKLLGVRRSFIDRRLIPAHAGKTGHPPSQSGMRRGSSPLTRGKR